MGVKTCRFCKIHTLSGWNDARQRGNVGVIMCSVCKIHTLSGWNDARQRGELGVKRAEFVRYTH